MRSTTPPTDQPSPGQIWCYNVMTVDTLGGSALRLLTVVDERTGTPLMIHASSAIDPRNVLAEFELLARSQGMPAGGCTFNTPLHIVEPVEAWLRGNGSVHIAPTQTFASSASGSLQRTIRRALQTARVLELADVQSVISQFIGVRLRHEAQPAPLAPRATATPGQAVVAAPAAEPAVQPQLEPVQQLEPAPLQPVTPRETAREAAATVAAIAAGEDVPIPAWETPQPAAVSAVPADKPEAEEAQITKQPKRRRAILARAATGMIVGVSALAVLVLGLGPLTGRYRTSPVLGNSMRPMFSKGDLVILLPKPSRDIRTNDVIQYMPTKGERVLVTHRVIRITNQGDNPTVITRGDNNNYEDPYPVTLQDDFAWRVRWHVPFVGWGLHAFQTPTGLIVLASAIGILLLMNAVGFVLDVRRTRRATRITAV